MKKSQLLVLVSGMIALIAVASFAYGVIRAFSNVRPDPRCGVKYSNFDPDNLVSADFARNLVISRSR